MRSPATLLLTTLLVVGVLGSAAFAQWGGSALSPPIITAKERAEEIAIKEARVADFLKKGNLQAILLKTYRNYSWITGGSEDTVVVTVESGPVTLCITSAGEKYALCPNDEEARNRDEELTGLGYRMVSWEWYKGSLEPNPVAEFVKGKGWSPKQVGADFDADFATNVEKTFSSLRFQLTASEMKRYRWLGRECAEACVETCREIRPGMTEKEIQRVIADKLMARQITPTVLLIAVDDRLFQYRHAIATDKKLEHYAQVNICAKRWGLVVAVTRYVHFGPIPPELGKRLRACARVNGAYLSAMEPGVAASDVLAAGVAMFERVGYPNEWRQHHQGGAIGYAEREWVAFPGDTHPIMGDMAFAWNPTILGAKTEETVIYHADGTIENITQTPGWPTIPIRLSGPAKGQVFHAPSILVR